MPHDRVEASGEALAAACERWNARDRSLDPQLPERCLDPGEGTLLVSPAASPAAAGVVHRIETVPDAADALWGALTREELEPRWDGDEAALGRVLDQWIAGAVAGSAPLGSPGDWEAALKVKMPARDSAAVLPLLARGFAPVGVIGIRATRRGAEARAGAASAAEARLEEAGYRMREAGAEDLPLLAELDCELLEHETGHGEVGTRPDAKRVIGESFAERLERDPGWTWILERESDGEPCGYLSVELDLERHRADCAAGGPVAYIDAMYLRETVRGGGIGESVVEFGHGRLEAAGFDRILLDYAVANPRSGPFWSRMGYRPLWYRWQRRPAVPAR